jgi:hypothetical protein
MWRSIVHYCPVLGVLVAGQWLLSGCDVIDERQRAVPAELHLWVWQRDEDLSFLETDAASIALWIATITVDQRGVEVAARASSVLYPSDARVQAVVRLEIAPGFEGEALESVSEAIGDLIDPLAVDELQIDFDARVSQRDFYRQLIDALRIRLPAHSLSITALASWCYGDPWIADLPIAAAVPMYFRMGEDAGQIGHYLSSGRQIPATICRDNAGHSLDEPEVPAARAQRIFVFSPEPWNENLLDRARTLFMP